MYFSVERMERQKTSEDSVDRAEQRRISKDVVPLYGRDEMNLIEFPFGPIRDAGRKNFEIEQEVWDAALKRRVKRRMLITGSDAFGLPRPIDEQVLVGMLGLTHAAGFASRKVEFSRYHLCRVLGWKGDGRAYIRLEESLDRLAGTTLKFKDAWFDKGESEYKSKTFHVIDEHELCSRDRLDRVRARTGVATQKLCYFVWSDVIWKSMQDGFIKRIDMEMFRRIAKGRRKEVALRLYRVLDKRAYKKKGMVWLNMEKLSREKLGLCTSYRPSEMRRVIERACRWLIECGYLSEYRFNDENTRVGFVVERGTRGRKRKGGLATENPEGALILKDGFEWIAQYTDTELQRIESEAVATSFGTCFERRVVEEERNSGRTVRESGFVRKGYVKKYLDEKGKRPPYLEWRGLTA